MYNIKKQRRIFKARFQTLVILHRSRNTSSSDLLLRNTTLATTAWESEGTETCINHTTRADVRRLLRVPRSVVYSNDNQDFLWYPIIFLYALRE